jgi:hypothetical protein
MIGMLSTPYLLQEKASQDGLYAEFLVITVNGKRSIVERTVNIPVDRIMN